MTIPAVVLAEALHASGYGAAWSDEPSKDEAEGSAVAILAVLPPNWCGHDGSLGPYYRKEIARLCAIEKAAQAAVLAARKMTPEIVALNAALAAKEAK